MGDYQSEMKVILAIIAAAAAKPRALFKFAPAKPCPADVKGTPGHGNFANYVTKFISNGGYKSDSNCGKDSHRVPMEVAKDILCNGSEIAGRRRRLLNDNDPS